MNTNTQQIMSDTNQDNFTATYSPEDNKLRLYSVYRLDEDLYKRVRAAGFIFAKHQDLFVAPMWTPSRADLLLELAGFIDDESMSLADRAAIRADRFEGYQANRLKDAEQAYNEVQSLTEDIPLGQPILIGHHSEKKARKQAEKIERAGQRAVDMWNTSEYWIYRTKGVLRNVTYKDRADVRARRIKGLQADIRKYKSYFTPDPKVKPIMQKGWSKGKFDEVETLHVYCGKGRGGNWVKQSSLAGIEAHYSRWIKHNELRINFEMAILESQNGLDLLKPPKRPKALPMLNYKAVDGINIENRYHKGEFAIHPQYEMTKAQFAKIPTDYKGTNIVDGNHRVRIAMDAYIEGVSGHGYSCIFITDSKTHEKPEAEA